jgi:hypothetical protein
MRNYLRNNPMEKAFLLAQYIRKSPACYEIQRLFNILSRAIAHSNSAYLSSIPLLRPHICMSISSKLSLLFNFSDLYEFLSCARYILKKSYRIAVILLNVDLKL